MARSVGNIEVVVDANTGKLKAQIVRASKEAGEAGGEALEDGLSDVDGKELIAKLRKIRAEAQRAMAGLEVEIDLDDADIRAELQRLQAQLKAVQLELFLTPEVDDPALQKELARARALVRASAPVTIEGEVHFDAEQARRAAAQADAVLKTTQATIDVKVDLETREAIAKLKAAAAVMNQENVELRVGADLSEINRDLRRMVHEAEHERVDVNFGADMREINLALRKLEAEAEATTIELRAALDTALYEAEVTRISEAHHEVEFQAELRTALFDAEIANMRLREEANEIEVGVAPKVDKRAKARTDATLLSNFKQVGGDSADGFLDSFSGRFKLIAGAVVLLTEPLTQALQGSLAALTSAASSAFSGLGGLAAGIGPGLAATGASVATLVVGFQGLGDAIGAVGDEYAAALEEGRDFNINAEDIQNSMRGLAPSAREFVTAFAELSPVFTEVRQIVQERLFEGLGDSLHSIAEAALPAVGAGLERVAGSFNRFFQAAAEQAEGIDFAGIFADLQPIIDDVLDAFLSLFDALEPFLAAAAPAAQMLSESFRLTADSLRDMIQSGSESGELTEFFVRGVESLRQWWDLLRNVGDALFTLFDAGRASGDRFISGLTDTIGRWDDWMESIEGQEALANFFAGGEQIMRDLLPLLEGAKGFFDNIISPESMHRFGEFTQALGDVLPVLGQIVDLVGRTEVLQALADGLDEIGEALQPVIPALEEAADAIGDTLLGAVEDVGPVLDELGGIIGDIAPIVQDLAEDLRGPLGDAFATIADEVVELAPHIEDMADAVRQALVEAVEAALPLLEGLGDVLGVVADAVTFLTDVFSGMPDQIQTVVIALGLLIGLSSRFGGLGSAISGALSTARTSIELLGTAAGVAKIELGNIFTGIRTADISKITDGFKGLGPALAQSAKGIGAAAGTAIASGLGIAFGAQMALEADDMSKQVMGVFTVIGSAVTAFAVGGPIVGGISLAVGAITTLFQHSATEARKARDEIKEYTSALEAMVDGADAAVVVQEVMENLADETETTKDTLDDLEFSVGGWARAMVKGTTTVSDGIEDLASRFGDAGEDIAEALDSGEIGVDDLLTALGEGRQMIGDFDLRPFINELNGMGLEAGDVADIFGFLRDEGAELKAGQEEVERAVRLAGGGLVDEQAAAEAAAEGLNIVIGATRDAGDETAITEEKIRELLGALSEDPDLNALEKMAEGLLGLGFPIEEAEADFQELKRSAEEADTAAQSLQDTLELFTGPAGKAAVATRQHQDNIDKLTEAMKGGTDAAKLRQEADKLMIDADEEVGDAAKKAAEKRAQADEAELKGGADNIKKAARLRAEADELLRAPGAKDRQRAADLRTFADALQDQARAMDITTDAGREASEVAEKTVEGLEAMADAAIAQGDSVQEAAVKMVGWRQEAIDTAKAAGATQEQAEALINTYGLTPDAIVTVFKQTDMTEAQKEALQYDEDLDGIPDAIETLVSMPGLSDANKELLIYDSDMDGIPDIIDTTVVVAGVPEATEAMDGVATQAETMPPGAVDLIAQDAGWQAARDATAEEAQNMPAATVKVGADTTGWDAFRDPFGTKGAELPATVKVGVDTSGWTAFSDPFGGFSGRGEGLPLPVDTSEIDEAGTKVADLTTSIETVPDIAFSVTASGVTAATTAVNNLTAALEQVKSKTITVTVNTAFPNGDLGNLGIPGSMAGEIINFPTLRRVGERGHREAIIPLDLPLNRITPDVRQMAALIRGEGKMTGGIGRQVNNYMTITPASADPGAVATQIINRAAALATR